jgi:hypothetical protein
MVNEELKDVFIMATRKSSVPSFQAIDDSVLGEYRVSNYSERVYSKVYYSIRSLCGLVAKRSLKEAFKQYSLEQLLEYASRKFDKSLEDLIVQNQISWQRRQEYAERNSVGVPSGEMAENNYY